MLKFLPTLRAVASRPGMGPRAVTIVGRKERLMHRSQVCSLLAVLACGGLAGSALDAQVQKLCKIGVSQDLCTTKTSFIAPHLTQCTKPAACQTLSGNLRLQGGLAANAPCDEVPELKGAVLTVGSTIDLRQQPPEPQRGSWSGTFTIAGGGVASSSGNLFATLGVGTHRLSCLEKCGKNCEPCYDATFDKAGQAWKIHTEGILDGTFTSHAHQSCHLRWSFQGTFTAPGTPNGPGEGPWGFCGAIDGVLECPCK
jgi:hypothetical protein